MKKLFALLLLCLFVCSIERLNAQEKNFLLKNVLLIDGTGGAPRPGIDLLIHGNSIAAVGAGLSDQEAEVINLDGKTIMPTLISTHMHIGTLKDTTTSAANYTRANILRQLKKYSDYGVENVLSLGTDRPIIFSGFRDSSVAGFLPGARLYSAGYGFGTADAPGKNQSAMDYVYRPSTPEEARKQVQELQKLRPAVVKIWVDDFNGSGPKMKPEIYQEIIRSCHQYKIRVAAHLYYLEDAQKLVYAGIDIIAHSIRDKEINDALLKEMKSRNIIYIPTLSLDEFAFIYGRQPEWINDPFFKNSLEPGVFELITNKANRDRIKASPNYQKNIAALEMAMRNLKKIYSYGILVSMGTDSGANPYRAQGFAEHHELELMVKAGLTPMEAIVVATKNAAVMLKIENKYGTLEKGKIADFIILSKSPEDNIRNTWEIESVWKAGKEVSKGPWE
jgi:imidazolonepropionase-like amidohydrolase